jgi:hypothetical protein
LQNEPLPKFANYATLAEIRELAKKHLPKFANFATLAKIRELCKTTLA